VCLLPLCTVAGGVEGVELIRQAVYEADVADGVPAVCDWCIEAIQLLSVLPLGCCNSFPQSMLCSFVLRHIA